MKYLRKFNSVAEANLYGAQGLLSPHTSIVAGKSAVNMVKVSVWKFTCGFDNDGKIINVSPVYHNVGDICYWDGFGLDYVPYTSWTSSLGTALAVCFIPSSHAVEWGDGRARFLSVKGVKADGTASDSEVTMQWGDQGTETSLTNYTKVPTWDNTVGGTTGSNSYGYISSDKFTSGTQNAIDASSNYSGSTPYIPSPYDEDGGFYADYARTISGNNALSDFAGLDNTSVLTSSGTHPAASACHLYSTSGIEAGSWYLPACGELAYMMPRFNIIQAALAACGGVPLVSSSHYWSSTEYNANNAYNVNAYNGSVNNRNKSNSNYVRPVVQLS